MHWILCAGVRFCDLRISLCLILLCSMESPTCKIGTETCDLTWIICLMRNY
ncbi:putative E3 ubiquitin-protein ligase HIP1 isoform X1 [Iris pallida]|uniref:E3 ubiquitin-protein ligase HIP1 isoform X1 n=1 Tax=Iris pallida TaxID=29817 RepID=A0AAX6F3T4_IRIPA|nr:putative E3 ubiquitin-protein ligase HIP1 isoform X1 [Iris pallida]